MWEDQLLVVLSEDAPADLVLDWAVCYSAETNDDSFLLSHVCPGNIIWVLTSERYLFYGCCSRSGMSRNQSSTCSTSESEYRLRNRGNFWPSNLNNSRSAAKRYDQAESYYSYSESYSSYFVGSTSGINPTIVGTVREICCSKSWGSHNVGR